MHSLRVCLNSRLKQWLFGRILTLTSEALVNIAAAQRRPIFKRSLTMLLLPMLSVNKIESDCVMMQVGNLYNQRCF